MLSKRPSTFDHCRAHYVDDSRRVIQVFVPWRGANRRQACDRRQVTDRRDEVRYEPQNIDSNDRRIFVDRRELVRQCDAYRLAKFNRFRPTFVPLA